MAVHQNHMLTKSIQDAILRLCTQHLNFKSTLEIDGIICISPGESMSDVVIKMHRTVLKPKDSNISTFYGNTSNTSGKPHMTNQESNVAPIMHSSIGSQKHNTDNSSTAHVEAYQQNKSDDTTLYYDSTDAVEDHVQRKQIKSHSTPSKHKRPINPDVSEPMDKVIKLEVEDADEDGNDIVDEETGAFRDGQDPGTIVTTSGLDNTGGSFTTGASLEPIGNLNNVILQDDKYQTELNNYKQTFPVFPKSSENKTNPKLETLNKKSARGQSGLMTYQCHLCLKTSKNAGDLKKHMRIHTGEKPYVCELCIKSFNRVDSLRRHERVVHGLATGQSKDTGDSTSLKQDGGLHERVGPLYDNISAMNSNLDQKSEKPEYGAMAKHRNAIEKEQDIILDDGAYAKNMEKMNTSMARNMRNAMSEFGSGHTMDYSNSVYMNNSNIIP